MARRLDDNDQLSFDIDALIHAADVEAAPIWQGAPLRFTTSYVAPADLDAAFEHWCFLNGHFDSLAKSHMWNRLIQLRGHVELGDHSIDTFTADLRCSTSEHRGSDSDCSCVGGLIVQAICEPCGWHVIDLDENAVVEAWHDHAVPGWRTLPVVPARIRTRNEKGLTKQAMEWITDHYPREAQVPGAPIITERSEHATRHVPNYSPWGGYDISHTALGERSVPSSVPAGPRAQRLAPPSPASGARKGRDPGHTLG